MGRIISGIVLVLIGLIFSVPLIGPAMNALDYVDLWVFSFGLLFFFGGIYLIQRGIKQLRRSQESDAPST
jgi:hypothetical protein